MKVINFFGAPCAGKSTSAAELFSLMKKNGVRCELITEVAKDMIYDGNTSGLKNQNLIFATQEHRFFRLLDKGIDYAITDSPLLFSAFYAPQDYPPEFKKLCFHFFNKYENMNFYLKRNHAYSLIGRIHNEEDSAKVDRNMHAFLVNNSIPFTEMLASDSTAQKVLDYLLLNKY